jgi:transposase-like protein
MSSNMRIALERLAKGESVTALATEYGVSRQTVYNYYKIAGEARRGASSPLGHQLTKDSHVEQSQ